MIPLRPPHLLMCLVFTVVGLGLSAAPAAAQPPGERLQYVVEYGPAKVATVQMVFGCPTQTYQPAALVARSQGFTAQVHPFRVRLDTFVEPQSGLSREGRTRILEEGVERSYRSRFLTSPAVRVRKEFRGRVSDEEIALPARPHDLLSWLMDLRRQRSWQPGTAYRYTVWDGWKLFVLEASVDAPEEVWTPAGAFSAHKVKLRRVRLHHEGEERFRPAGGYEELGTVWLQREGSRRPVAMDFRAPIGRARILLTATERLSCRP